MQSHPLMAVNQSHQSKLLIMMRIQIQLDPPKKSISTHFLYRVVIHQQLIYAAKLEHRQFLMIPYKHSFQVRLIETGEEALSSSIKTNISYDVDIT